MTTCLDIMILSIVVYVVCYMLHTYVLNWHKICTYTYSKSMTYTSTFINKGNSERLGKVHKTNVANNH